jgi:hypothetical protein
MNTVEFTRRMFWWSIFDSKAYECVSSKGSNKRTLADHVARGRWFEASE